MKIKRIALIVNLMANGGDTASLLGTGIVLLSSLMFCIIALPIVSRMEIFNRDTLSKKGPSFYIIYSRQ